MKKRNRKYWLIFWLAIITGIVVSGIWIWYNDHWQIRTQLSYNSEANHPPSSNEVEKGESTASISEASE
ncbi:MAG: hypothetical protein J6562_04480 [Candidatus Schmidhempelia sp.]|nr:hypothetical protein [Candidatus Schmidhempelia sp.]